MGRPDDGRRRSSSRGVGRGGGCRRVRDADAAEHGGGDDDRRLRGPADGGSRVDAPLDDCHPARGPAEAGGIHARGVVGSVVGSVGGGGDERAGPPRAGPGAPGARAAAQRNRRGSHCAPGGTVRRAVGDRSMARSRARRRAGREHRTRRAHGSVRVEPSPMRDPSTSASYPRGAPSRVARLLWELT